MPDYFIIRQNYFDQNVPAAGPRLNLIWRYHARLHVFVDVAVVYPVAGVVGNHVHGFHPGRRERGHIPAPAALHHYFAMPVRRVKIGALAQSDQVPAQRTRSPCSCEKTRGLYASLRLLLVVNDCGLCRLACRISA
jgi:hypothetical protein